MVGNSDMHTWTKIAKAAGTSWTKIAKAGTQTTVTAGTPIGLLLALTYATSNNVTTTTWTKSAKSSGTAWTKIAKAT